MLIDGKRFARFLADNFELVEALSRYSRFTAGELGDLTQEFQPDHLIQRGLLDYIPETREYSLRPSVCAMVRDITRSRHLSSAHVTQVHVTRLNLLLMSMEQCYRDRDWFNFEVEREGLRRAMVDIHSDVHGNLDAIRKQTSDYRTRPLGSAKKRLEILGGIWQNQIVPMEAVFIPRGPIDAILEQIQSLLKRAEMAAVSSSEAEGDLRHTYFEARRLTRSAGEAHLEAIREVRPLYEAAKRNEQVASAASALIAGCFENQPSTAPLYADRRPGQAHALDGIFGIASSANEGEDRFFTPFPSDEAKAILVDRFYGYRPTKPPTMQRPVPTETPFVITERMVKRALAEDALVGPIEDVLAWLINTFPRAELKDVVRAYGWVVLKWNGRANPDLDVVNRKGGYLLYSHPVAARNNPRRIA